MNARFREDSGETYRDRLETTRHRGVSSRSLNHCSNSIVGLLSAELIGFIRKTLP